MSIIQVKYLARVPFLVDAFSVSLPVSNRAIIILIIWSRHQIKLAHDKSYVFIFGGFGLFEMILLVGYNIVDLLSFILYVGVFLGNLDFCMR